jgi:hypothetical protein
MEIIKEGEDRKEIKADDKTLESYLRSWRASDFYGWVHKILDEEIARSYLKDIMAEKFMNKETMSNEEIGELARIELQASLRVESIKELLK